MPKLEVPDELDSLDGVDAKYHALFVKDEGSNTYRYKDPKVLQESMRRAKEEKQEAIQARDKAIADAKKFEGVDLDRIKDYDNLKSELETLRAAGGNIDEVKRTLENTFNERISARDKEIDTLKHILVDGEKERAIRQALLSAGASDKHIPKLIKMLAGDIQHEFVNGKPVLKIMEGGKLKLNKEADPMSVDDLVSEFKETMPELFKATGRSGSGATAVENTDPPENKTPSKWTEKQKTAYIEKFGDKSYMELVFAENFPKEEKK